MSELARIRELARGALDSLERSRRRIDDLNVYPVPDGDTGTNLTLTARSVVEQLDGSATADRPGLVKEVTRAALMGARGNSGVILSQIIRGAAETLVTDGEVGTHTLARAFRSASDAAYRAVRQPVEGTMLSVIREMAEEAELRVGEGLTNVEFLHALVRRGETAVDRTPEQLEVLRESGVVDAGGYGLVLILAGVVAGLRGDGSEVPAIALEKKDKGAILRKCLTGLSAEHREIVDLVYYHEKSVEEVASIVGIPENTVKTRMFYARKRLAELLKAAGIERGWP